MSLNALRKPLATLGVMFGLLLSTQAQAVIIIRGRDGGCRLCIGSWHTCEALCGAKATQLSGYSQHMALELSDGKVVEGDSLSISDVDGGTAVVEMLSGDQPVFKERVDLEKTALRDLENGQINTLDKLVGLTCQ
ncbi:hypothetical protein JYK02_03205 [Corallococcus macrosporus]|uniref:Uncharacterized protein n=1 Tax=Corallococcus macrosporus TaxID=35 RepID=A0ABS3D6G4_9BACT|nr:hypothetical protein [Corallococcus macrosporus]MBN8226511.1 hypothetical protein [Corallococcus macrosporus]